jgi:hypothetical protein
MKKRRKRWPLVLAASLLVLVALPLALWFGIKWLVSTTLKGPASVSSAKIPGEKILPEERKQLERILKRRS